MYSTRPGSARPSSARPQESVNAFFETASRRSPRGSPRLNPAAPNPHLYHSGQIDPATWWRLHTMKTNSKTYKEREPMMSMTFNEMYITDRPTRPFAQPSLPSPRYNRPQSARGALTQSFLQQAKNYPRFKAIVAQIEKAPEMAVQTEVTGEMVQAEMEAEQAANNNSRAWGELPPGVTEEDVRKCAGAIREKLLDKFGTLQKAFRAMDEDASGDITRKELERYLEIINLHTIARKDVLTALFETIDADASGNFDFKEFSRVMSAGDVMKMKKIEDRFDGYQAKLDEEAARERAQLEYTAKQAGMTVEEYQNYWAETNQIFGGAAHLQKASDLAVVARDRWGKKIKNGNLSALGG